MPSRPRGDERQRVPDRGRARVRVALGARRCAPGGSTPPRSGRGRSSPSRLSRRAAARGSARGRRSPPPDARARRRRRPCGRGRGACRRTDVHSAPAYVVGIATIRGSRLVIRPASSATTALQVSIGAAAAEPDEPVGAGLADERRRLAHRLDGDVRDGRRRRRRRREARRGAAAPRRVATRSGRSSPASPQTSASSASEPAPKRTIRAPAARRSLAGGRGHEPEPARASRSARARTSTNASATRVCARAVPRTSEISRRPSIPSMRASASAPDARSDSTAAREMNVTP